MDIKELLVLSRKDRKESKYSSEFNKRQEDRQKIFYANWESQKVTDEFLRRRYVI